MDTPEKIQRLMALRGFDIQRDFARRLGLHPSKVNRFVNGKFELKAIEWVRLARELGVSVDYLLDPAREAEDDELSREDWAIVLMARSLGHKEAMARLMLTARGQAEAGSSPPKAGEIVTKPPTVEQGGKAAPPTRRSNSKNSGA